MYIKQQASLSLVYGSWLVTKAARCYLRWERSSREITCLEMWFTLNYPKWLIVYCKHWNVVGVLCGLPQCAHHEHSVLILGGGCLDGTPHPLLQAIFCLACFSKSTYECRPLCCWCCAEQDSSKVKTLDQAWPMHAVIMTPAMDERTRKRIRQTKTHWDGLKGKRSANGSKKKRKKAPQPFLSAYNTPLRPAFLVAHLRKTSVPPHDAELRVSFCL